MHAGGGDVQQRRRALPERLPTPRQLLGLEGLREEVTQGAEHLVRVSVGARVGVGVKVGVRVGVRVGVGVGVRVRDSVRAQSTPVVSELVLSGCSTMQREYLGGK
eukprot:scaffold108711_cov59-Phaeocystis_antarctica.AAC.6